MRAVLLWLVCGLALADAKLIGESSTHLMFNYHGDLIFCPREVESYGLVTCLDSSLKYIICRMIPRELGYLDCGHKTIKAPAERQAKIDADRKSE